MFKKFPDIENHYRQKFVDGFLHIYPELKDQWYMITEKRDGANLQLIFNPNYINLSVASRKRIISPEDDFYDVFNVLNNYHELIDYIQKLAKTSNMHINVYGELFGSGIQKRIDYGDDKYFELFDIYLQKDGDENGWFVSQEFINNDKILSKYMVPVIGVVKGIENALNSNPADLENGKIEGIVIKPYRQVYVNKVGKLFYLKKKSPAFSEKGNKEKKKEKPKFDENVEELHRVFGQYVNKNRVLSIFSKHGEIQEPSQIGEYIKLVLEDAKDDFFKDGYVISELDSKEIKYVYNHSKKIVPILQEYL